MRSMVDGVGQRRRSEASAMSVLSLAEVRATVRKDFYSFLVRCFAELHAGRTFSPAWHAEVLAAKLQGVREGQVKRLVVNVPPRHLKSLAASVALPAWLLGHDPTLAIINVTYAQDLSDKFARDCRAVMASDWYQERSSRPGSLRPASLWPSSRRRAGASAWRPRSAAC